MKKKIQLPPFGPLPGGEGHMITRFFFWLEELEEAGIIAKQQIYAARAEYLRRCELLYGAKKE